ncbi:helix-turn-helix domain-containing protein [Methylohalobius crimeensis]|uniref:helix-turn-helix domain-containing protein n=1 Tax=Methylohalobius crimeensis TaxID=244365 RepID=UPI0038995605
MLEVSERTIRRMVEDGELTTVRVRGRQRIPVFVLEEWLKENACSAHNSSVTRAGHCQPKEDKQCHEKTKTGSTNARTRPTGGLRTPTQAAKELAAVLELPTGGKPKRS